MRQRSLVLGIFLVVLILVFYLYKYSEGFETMEDKIQDRTNPLAGAQQPLTNPAVKIGISEADGEKLRGMSQTALNVKSSVPDGAGSLKQQMPANTVSPRSDNENSYLGLIKMCKEKGVGETPFGDSAFNESCGMCITSGTLKTGESFTRPTGVLVYRRDKDDAIRRAAQNGYPFARAIPSVDSATCDGASRDNNSLPVLAINQADYDAFRKRKACRDGHKIGDQCGRCIADNESTWISPSGGKQPFTLYLWGAGKATVSLATGFKSDELSLSGSSTKVPIGRVEEGTGIQISVLKGESIDGPYIYGVIVSATAAKGVYKLPIEKFFERDTISGSAPRRNGIKYFEDAKVFCTKLMPQNNKDMNLTGFIPVTLVEMDQLAAFDCASAPLVQSQGSAELLIDDVCLNPRGQGPGNYTEDCIRQTILQGGCSTNGDWYKNPSKSVADLASYLNYIREKATSGEVNTDPAIAMGCKGINITTPCDAFLNGGVPDKQCMTYLYSNKSEGTRVGRAYKNADTKYASMTGNTVSFCRPGAGLDPASDNAMGTLRGIAGGYKGVSGIEAVKMYLSDVFMKAVGSLDANVDDDKGGRKTSWQQCIGMKIADVSVPDVTTNSTNDVIDTGGTTGNTNANKMSNRWIIITYSSKDNKRILSLARLYVGGNDILYSVGDSTSLYAGDGGTAALFNRNSVAGNTIHWSKTVLGDMHTVVIDVDKFMYNYPYKKILKADFVAYGAWGVFADINISVILYEGGKPTIDSSSLRFEFVGGKNIKSLFVPRAAAIGLELGSTFRYDLQSGEFRMIWEDDSSKNLSRAH